MAEESPLSVDGELTEYEYEQLSRALPDGLYGDPSDVPPVSFSGGQVIVRSGLSGSLRGFPWKSTSDTIYTPDLSGSARTDLVVLRLDRPAGHEVASAYKGGTAGAGAPAVTTDETAAGLYEIPLAEVNIASGAITSVKRRCWYIGADGQILADTDDTMPPHVKGRRVWRTDSKREYVSTGSAPWRVQIDDSGQLPITLVSGWSFSSEYCRRLDGQVMAQFSIKRTGGAIGSSRIKVATLPSSCRPDQRFETTAYVTAASNGSGKYPCFAEFRDNGEVWADLHTGIAKGAWLIVSSVSFVPA